jgi:hypothetical protein
MIITFDNWWTVLHELNVSIDNAFKEAGVTIAFPQRDARSDATGPLEVRAVSEPFGSEAQIRSCAFGKRVLGKKLFKASSLRQGGRICGEHPAVQDRSKISWF